MAALVNSYYIYFYELLFRFNNKEKALSTLNIALNICEKAMQEYESTRIKLQLIKFLGWKSKLLNSICNNVLDILTLDKKRLKLIAEISPYLPTNISNDKYSKI